MLHWLVDASLEEGYKAKYDMAFVYVLRDNCYWP